MKFRGRLKNLKMEERFLMKQEPSIPSLGEVAFLLWWFFCFDLVRFFFFFWRNITNSNFRVPGIPSDMGDNVVLLTFF